MTVTLHLGVVDVPYVASEPPRKAKARIAKNAKLRKPKHAAGEHKTTGDVAEIIEAKYGLFEAFFDNHEVEIVGAMEKSLARTLEGVFSGAPLDLDPFGGGTSRIEEMFRDFLSTREAERVGIPGTPTAAARAGINHRFKHPYAKENPRRPSFVDTGLLQASFKAWVT